MHMVYMMQKGVLLQRLSPRIVISLLQSRVDKGSNWSGEENRQWLVYTIMLLIIITLIYDLIKHLSLLIILHYSSLYFYNLPDNFFFF